MSYDKIPAELRALKQWVSFQIGPDLDAHQKLRKVPFIPGTQRKASPTNPEDWTFFAEALKGGHPAFCLSKDDPYVFIDVDERADDKTVDQLFDIFPSYTELSTSQAGLHIIGRGKLVHGGHRRGGIELYDRDRFCIFTGNILDGKDKILEFATQELLDLEYQMGACDNEVLELDDLPEEVTDKELKERCDVRYVRFNALFRGLWKEFGDYPSQSEADHALIGMLADQSKSNRQVKRVFEQSALYREKKDRNYVFRALSQTFRPKQKRDEANQQMFAQLANARKEELKAAKPKAAPPNTSLYNSIPQGLIRDLYKAYQNWAYMPLKEGSLIAALATGIALFQRKYQTESKLALNMWLFLLGPTSAGKEIISNGPSALFAQAKAPMQGVWGGELRSDSGVEEALKGSARHVAYHGECAAWLQQLCCDENGSYSHKLRAKLLETYTKGDASNMLHFGRKKKDKNATGTEVMFIERPCLTLLGDAVPSKFYQAVAEGEAASGFIPRFTVLEADRGSMSIDPGPQTEFPSALLDLINVYATEACMADTGSNPVIVPMEPGVKTEYNRLSREIRKAYVDGHEDEQLDDILRTRSPAKIAKLATLLAVSQDTVRPVVRMEHLKWAIQFVEFTDGLMAKRIVSGQFTTGSHKQMENMQRLLTEATCISPRSRSCPPHNKFYTSDSMRDMPDIVPIAWLRDRASKLSCFQKDRRGTSVAIASTIRDMETDGLIYRLSRDYCTEKFGYAGEALRII